MKLVIEAPYVIEDDLLSCADLWECGLVEFQGDGWIVRWTFEGGDLYSLESDAINLSIESETSWEG